MSETVNAILYEGHIAVFMPDERPIKHVVLESPSEKGMQGDLSWRYYMPESYTTTLANENAKLRDLVRVLHVAHVGMVNRYKDNETECIWEYGCDIENNIRKLESECEKECHRFDAAMRELGVEVQS